VNRVDLQPLADRVALVSGASRGIGAATARLLAQTGAQVVITHRDSEAGARAVLESLAGTGHRVIRASAADTPALEAAAAEVASAYGRLDVLVNNAATTRVIPHADLRALDDELFDTILSTNVRGAFATIRAFHPLLRTGGGGVIVNVSSLAARMANGSNVAYCASKAAMDNLTVSLARALAPEVRVLSVAPGLVDTHLTRAWDPAVRQHMIEHTPLGRLATPDDVAAAILAAVVSLPSTTGVVIPVDGGRPLG
jgi:3-oxoacyl-[acyl-carrier protein] reductase